MDEFFDGLGCRLRSSGMVADSVMIGIVNSAMEERFDKVCSKEGNIERLNEKSRFYELAILQLEWCLKFLQEEIDSYIVENKPERERLVSDLTETRDRIQRRLEETEVAISEKDRELNERLENELKLRQALEMKDRELKSLHSNPKPKRTKSEGAESSWVDWDKGVDGEFSELRNTVDQKFWNIKQTLKDEQINLTRGMRKINHHHSGAFNSEPDEELMGEKRNWQICRKTVEFYEFYENNKSCEIEPLNFSSRPELNTGFEKMGSDIDILKETLDLAFGMMDNAISLSEVGPIEQQWRCNIEKDISAIVCRGFLSDIQKNFESKVSEGRKKVTLGLLGASWSNLMDEMTELRQELELLVSQTVIPVKDRDSATVPSQSDAGYKVTVQSTNHSRESSVSEGDCGSAVGRCDMSNGASVKVDKLEHMEEPLKDDQAGGSCNFVSKIVRNHESIIRQKNEELNWLKGEILREKGSSSSRKDKDSDSLKKRILDIIVRLDNTIKGSDNLDAKYDDYECISEDKILPSKSLSQYGLASDKTAAIHDMSKVPEKVDREPHFCSVDSDMREVIKQLKQEREDSSFQTMIAEDIYVIFLRKEVKDHLELYNNFDTESLIKEDVFKDFFRKMVDEWNNDVESYKFESQIKEEIYQIVFSEVVRDFCCRDCLTSKECLEARTECVVLEDFSSTDNMNEQLEDLVREDVLMIYLQEIVKEWNKAIESYDTEGHIGNEWQEARTEVLSPEDSLSADNLVQNMDGIITDGVLAVYLQEMVKEWNKAITTYSMESCIREELYQTVSSEGVKDIRSTLSFTSTEYQENWGKDNLLKELPSRNLLNQNLGELIRVDVHAVFLREMVKELNRDIENYNIESHIREDIYLTILNELVKESECTQGSNLIVCRENGSERNFQEDSLRTNDMLQNIETLISEDVLALFLQEMIREWNSLIENYNVVSHTRGEIHHIEPSELVKDTAISAHIKVKECQNALRNNFFPEDSSSRNMFFQCLECLVREDILSVLFRTMVLEWNMEIESYIIENLIKDEINGIAINGAVKDVKIYLTECQDTRNMDNYMEELPFIHEFQSSKQKENENLIHKLGSLSRCFDVKDKMTVSEITDLVKQNLHLDLVSPEHKELDERNIQTEGMLFENDNVLASASNNLKKTWRQIIINKAQLREMGTALGFAVEDLEQVDNQITPIKEITQDGENSFGLPKRKEELQAIVMKILKEYGDIEHMMNEKFKRNTLRLEELQYQLDILVEHVASLQKKELLYRKAFTRRCFDLQKAEAEVDLLGDEVDTLLSLLEKIYITVNHYSPVLQHCFGVMDILDLIRKELSGISVCSLHKQ
ncbi:uncharacterized protein LOC122660956 [Telopea speciosissima]|uniref:uncharacterized protein LOC122660956 n=1 Tax=Telopea speciosissima TaxID=54955 RepID=UPI001CC6CF11|nr:uncharacterized protein LOC122660956 [Telopea speciosissima]